MILPVFLFFSLRFDFLLLRTFLTKNFSQSIAIWSFWKKRPLTVRKQAHGQDEKGNGRWIVALAVLPYSDLLASGSNEGELKLWKIGENFRSITPFFSYSIPGFINSIAFSSNGKSLVVGAGKEHKDGRWWVDREARNQVVILPIRYTDGSDDVATSDDVTMTSGSGIRRPNALKPGEGGIESGDSDEEEEEKEDVEQEEVVEIDED
ncbi:hypothetical protein B9Z55_008011 [Caenorhabditis nigoni]|uniref:Uncharacterized protein n=1 Tax=Caenorhabditis nigoni TaxID=1611254 RepID=A0A2G5VC94_9PELO|nr:hypothetical protein B9Z55_008011 [Caenorhabditis nigoni]